MADVSALRAINERLKPLRRLLADLDTGVDEFAALEGQQEAKTARIAALTAEIAGLEAERATLAEARDQAERAHKDVMAQYSAEERREIERLSARLAGLETDLREAEAQRQGRLADLDRQYAERREALIAEEVALTSRVRALRDAEAEFTARAAKLLGR